MAVPEKSAWEVAKGAFIRARNTLASNIQKGAEGSITLATKSHLDKYYFKLQEAHNKYLDAAQISIEESQEDANYLDQPYQELMDAE